MATKLGLQVASSGGGQVGTYTPVSATTDGKWTNAAAPYLGPIAVTLSAGVNDYSIPSGAIGILIVSDTDSTNPKRVYTSNGDNGIPLKPGYLALFYFDTGATHVAIVSTGTESIAIHWL